MIQENVSQVHISRMLESRSRVNLDVYCHTNSSTPRKSPLMCLIDLEDVPRRQLSVGSNPSRHL